MGRTRTTIADGLRVPSAIGDFLILRAIRESGGTAVAVADRDMVDGMLAIGKHEGISAAPEGGAALASPSGSSLQHGTIQADESVVLFNTGGALKYLRRAQAVRDLHQSPNVTPSAFAVSSRSKSSGTVFVFPTTSSSGRATMSGGSNATIVPNSPLRDQLDGLAAETRRQHAIEARRRAAALQVAEHDRPRLLARRAAPAPSHTCAPMPPSRSARPSCAASSSDSAAALRIRAFGDDDDAELRAPAVALAAAASATMPRSKGISGIRIASAPPATPA